MELICGCIRALFCGMLRLYTCPAARLSMCISAKERPQGFPYVFPQKNPGYIRALFCGYIRALFCRVLLRKYIWKALMTRSFADIQGSFAEIHMESLDDSISRQGRQEHCVQKDKQSPWANIQGSFADV